MAAATSAFLVDRREVEFILFEYLKIETLLALPHYSMHSKESLSEMIGSAIDFSYQTSGPLNKIGDRIGCQHDKVTKEVKTPPGTKEAYKLYVESGFLTASDSEEAGGLQTPGVMMCAFLELNASANQAFAMYPGLTKSASHVLWSCGEEWMRKYCVPKFAEGKWTGTMCLTEPSAGSAVGDLKTTAKRMPDGTFRIKGVKQWISGGENDFAENILHLVLARIEGAPQGMEGVSLFLVPKNKIDPQTGSITGKNDLYCISLEEKMGIHGNSTCLMGFGDNDNCEGFLIGKENHGISYMFLMMNEARIAVGLQGVAQSSVAFLNAEAYAKERIQGVDVTLKKEAANLNRIAIIQHPDVKRMLLRQRAIVEGARSLCYLAGYIYDLSLYANTEEEKKKYHNSLELITPIVKAWCSDMGYNSIVLSVQTYGGYGFTKDYPVEQMLRDSKIASIYEGTNGIQALDFVGRKMRMEEGEVFMAWLERHTNFIEDNKSHAIVGPECEILEEHIGLLIEGAMKMSELGKSGQRKAAIVNAYPYLMAFGHIIIAGLLLEQAVIASEKINDGTVSPGDKRFYRNKIKTAKFFTHHILPEAKAYLSNVTSSDTSCLDFEF